MGNKIKKKERKMEKLVYICNIAAQIELIWRIPAIYWCNYVFYPMSRSDQIRVERSRGKETQCYWRGRKKRDNETRDSVVFGRHRFASIESWNHEKLSPCFLNKPRSRGEGRRFPWRKFRKFIFKGKMSSLFWG